LTYTHPNSTAKRLHISDDGRGVVQLKSLYIILGSKKLVSSLQKKYLDVPISSEHADTLVNPAIPPKAIHQHICLQKYMLKNICSSFVH
jgi:hypothetical protein